MLYLNMSEEVLEHWGRTIDLYFALHLGGFHDDIKSVNLMIEEETLGDSEAVLYQCELKLITKIGEQHPIRVERENCGAAIEQCFAKAKRLMLRRIRGLADAYPLRQFG